MSKWLFFFLILSAFCMTGCFQAYSDGDDDLRTVPVTNNPHIVPSHGSGIPNMPQQMR